MRIEKRYGPAATALICHLENGERLVAESGAMMALQGKFDIETTTRQNGEGGLLKGLKRMLSRQSFFMNHFTARTAGEIWLGSPLPGDMFHHSMNGEKIVVTGGNFLASAGNISIDLEWQGLKSFFSGENLFWIKARGHGELLASSFGFIYQIEVDGEYIVDTGHIVAFEETLNFEISRASRNWLEAYLSGEGFVCRFKGRGKLWCQSHNPRSYGLELRPYLRAKRV